MRSRFAHHAGAMSIHSLHAYPQRARNFLVRLPGDHKIKDLPLPASERLDHNALFQQLGETPADDTSAVKDVGDRPHQLFSVVRFAKNAIGANLNKLGDLSACFNPSEDNDLGRGRPAPCFKEDFCSASMRHGYVEHEKIWPVLSNSDDRLDPVPGLRHHFNGNAVGRLSISQKPPERSTNNRMVVRNDCRIGLAKAQSRVPPVAMRLFYRIALSMWGNIRLSRLSAGLWAMLLALCFGAGAASAQTVLLKEGESVERVEFAASYLVLPRGEEIGVEAALAAHDQGQFGPDMVIDNDGALHDWRTWIALPFRTNADSGERTLRRIIGLGGIFVELPRVYLVCEGQPLREVLASASAERGALSARYFTYIRTQSFDIAPGQECLALINAASNDNPNIGIFREGELGSNQVVAVLLKAGFTVILLIIGIVLTIVAYLTNRPLTMLFGITYFIVMVQNETSLFSTTFADNPSQGRTIWEALTLLSIFSCYWSFLFAFRREFRLDRKLGWRSIAILLPTPLIAIAYFSDATPDLIWALYLGLFLFAAAVALRFDVSKQLRWFAGAILVVSVVAAVLVEPYFLGRYFTDLTIEFSRDAVRLFAGLGMLLLLLVDVVRSRRERDSLTEERIISLESQADSNRRLLEAERQYARAREVASRHKAQLASAGHDIRQPIAGLKGALRAEAANVSPGFLAQANHVIDYLEDLTKEYSSGFEGEGGAGRDEESAYSINIVLSAVREMFSQDATAAGIDFTVTLAEHKTQTPALGLIRATSNLVANALRHAEPNCVAVLVEHHECGEIDIVIRDDGHGMSRDALDDHLQRGHKGEQSLGDGLGLAIVQELASRHGFGFTLHSEPGRGTTARIRLKD